MRISDWSSDVCSSDLEKDVEEKNILRGEDADHQHLHQQKGRHIFSAALINADPTRADADGHQDNGQHYQHERNAVYSHRPCEPAKYRSEEHTSELQSLMRSSYAVFCLKKTKPPTKKIERHN